jgi:hypothetical protein
MIKIFRLVFFILLLCSASFLFSQTGGQRVYSFLNLPSSARVTAGGGAVMALTDADVSLSYHNPALLNRQMHGRITASTAAYYAGINFGYFGYAHNIKNIVMMQGGIQYLAYGTFKGADVTGNENGTFKANEIALHAGVSRTYGTKYHYGMNLKLISSSYESYSSFGLSTDWAAAYFDSARNFTASLLIKNIGFQFKPYIKGNRDPLPVDIQLGFSKRLKHVPFRIGVVAHSLNRFNMRYEDNTEQTNVVFGDTAESEKKAAVFFDNVARHFILNGEFYFGKAVVLGFGYNHQRRKEMAVETKNGLAGFSVGLGINIKMFSFWYARGRHHIAGASNQFTIAVDVNKFLKKNKISKPAKNIEPPAETLPVQN